MSYEHSASVLNLTKIVNNLIMFCADCQAAYDLSERGRGQLRSVTAVRVTVGGAPHQLWLRRDVSKDVEKTFQREYV